MNLKKVLESSKPVSWLTLFFLFSSIVFAIWSIYPFVTYPTISGSVGTFGDSYGALNTLFSGLAFGALGATFWLQKTELFEQRRRNSFQGLENAFFQLINIHNEIAKDFIITGEKDGIQRQGKAAFRSLMQNIEVDFSKVRGKNREEKITKTLQNILRNDEICVRLLLDNAFSVFCVFNELLAHNEDSSLKLKYPVFYRSTLSLDELTVLFLYAAYSPNDPFKEKLEEYEFFTQVAFPDFCKMEDFKKFSPSAFGGRYPSR